MPFKLDSLRSNSSRALPLVAFFAVVVDLSDAAGLPDAFAPPEVAVAAVVRLATGGDLFVSGAPSRTGAFVFDVWLFGNPGFFSARLPDTSADAETTLDLDDCDSDLPLAPVDFTDILAVAGASVADLPIFCAFDRRVSLRADAPARGLPLPTGFLLPDVFRVMGFSTNSLRAMAPPTLNDQGRAPENRHQGLSSSYALARKQYTSR